MEKILSHDESGQHNASFIPIELPVESHSAFSTQHSACPDFGFRIFDFGFNSAFRIRNSAFGSLRVPFTLIELLVVIAIISLLMAMLLPALSRIKQLTRMTVCASNQRQTGIAFIAYATDYNGNLPSSEAPGSTINADGNIDDSTAAGNYNRYSRLGSNGTLWIEQMDGVKGYDNGAYTCPAGLPADNDKTGDLDFYSTNWTWACRTRPHPVENWSTTIPNDKRSWFSYLAPLREITPESGNGYDRVNLGWGWNNALSPDPPISWPDGASANSRNYKNLRVIAFCPIQELLNSGNWPTVFRAPHMNRPIGPPWAISSSVDARNYLFNDGHVQRLVR